MIMAVKKETPSPLFEVGDKVCFKSDGEEIGEVMGFSYQPNGDEECEWQYKISSKSIDMAKKELTPAVRTGYESEIERYQEPE